ncbi:MAG: CHASE2 domain-containing protein [Candidatus Rokuibacteriota bacterium]
MTVREGAQALTPGGARRCLFACGVVLSLVVGGLGLSRPSLLAHLDRRVYDLLLRMAHDRETSGRLVIVDVDERSLARFGRWPWPRSRLARLLSGIRALGASSIGLDMMFPEPDDTPLPPGERQPAGRGGLPDSSGPLAPNDAALAAALSEGPFVVGYEFTFGGDPNASADCRLHPLPVSVLAASGAGPAPLFRASGAICSLPGLAGAAAGSGFLNAAPDPDGILRRVPLMITRDGATYPSLAVATVIAALGPRRNLLRVADGGAESLILGDRLVPLDPRGNLLLHFRGGTRTFPYVSAADVLEERVPAGSLRDKIVFVGTSAFGLRETVVTPLDTTYVGVELHATTVDNVLRGDFFRRPLAAPAIELGLTLAVGIGAALAVAWAGVAWGGAIVAGVGAGLSLGAGWLLGALGIFLSPLFPVLALSVSFTGLTLASALLERRRADRLADDVHRVREIMLQSLTSLTEMRDHETGGHLLRTRRYAQVLCGSLASDPRFRDRLTQDTIELIVKLAPIHDIGKVGVPDLTLRKPGPLTSDERAQMSRHPEYGRDVIANAERRVGIDDDRFLRLAKDIVYSHHEWWDGTGYPERLRGETIPVAARIVAVIDVYDALISRRVYKERLPHEDVVRAIVAGQGSQFDPGVVEAFLRIQDEWRRISLDFTDDDIDRTHP